MKILQFGPKKISIDSDEKRTDPHANEQVRKGFFRTPLGTEGAKTGSKEGDTEWSPHVPLPSDFLVVTFAGHGDLDLIKNVVQISFLHDSLDKYDGIDDGFVKGVDFALVRGTAETLELGALDLLVEGNWLVHDGFYIQKFIIFRLY